MKTSVLPDPLDYVKLFWIHLDKQSGSWVGVNARRLSGFIRKLDALVVMIARCRGRFGTGTEYQEKDFHLSMMVSRHRSGSVAVGVGPSPALFQPRPLMRVISQQEKNLDDVSILIKELADAKDFPKLDQMFPINGFKKTILNIYQKICPTVDRTAMHVSYATFQEPFDKCPVDVTLGPKARAAVDRQLLVEKEKPVPELFGRFVGFRKLIYEFYLLLASTGAEVKCYYDQELFQNFTALAHNVDIKEDDYVVIKGTYTIRQTRQGFKPVIEDVQEVIKVDLEEVKAKWQTLVVSDPEVCHGLPCFKGSRILVSVVLDLIWGGNNDEAIQKELPSLTREQLSIARKANFIFGG